MEQLEFPPVSSSTNRAPEEAARTGSGYTAMSARVNNVAFAIRPSHVGFSDRVIAGLKSGIMTQTVDGTRSIKISELKRHNSSARETKRSDSHDGYKEMSLHWRP